MGSSENGVVGVFIFLTDDIPLDSVAVGVPAKVVKKLCDQTLNRPAGFHGAKIDTDYEKGKHGG